MVLSGIGLHVVLMFVSLGSQICLTCEISLGLVHLGFVYTYRVLPLAEMC